MAIPIWRERFKLVRAARTYTQDEVGAILDTGGTKISDIERGKQSPVFEDMLKLAHAMHFSLDELGAPGEFDLKACLLSTWPGKDPTLKEKVMERARLKAMRKKHKR